MPTVANSARITLHGLDTEGINENSPLEDQVVLTYRAVSHYATLNGWVPYVHRGKPGRKGSMVMKRITETLFPKASSTQQDRMNGLINQVLRKTDAAVCIAHPQQRGESPTWFVADSMPGNLVVVALSHAKSATDRALADGSDRAKREERLTPQEAGETLPPGEVTITVKQPEQQPTKRFEELAAERRAEHSRFLDAIITAISESEIPLTARELAELQSTDYGESAVRDALIELERDEIVTRRLETPEERMIRGGGQAPRGKRMMLWWPAPGPVPERTRLPDGVAPYRTAQEWADLKKQELQKAMDSIIEVMSRSYGRGSKNRPKSPSQIASATGLTINLTHEALDRLVSLEQVYVHNYCYYLTSRRRTVGLEPEPEPETEPTPEATPETDDRSETVQEFLRLARILAEPSGDSQELERLRAENARLQVENEKLTAQVRALKAAIATMD